MLHEEKVIIAQHRIPDETTETTEVKELLDSVNLDIAVVTADAAHAQRETAEYIAGKKEDGNRGSDYFLFVIWKEDTSLIRAGNAPQVWSAITNLVITLFCIHGVTSYTEETRRCAQDPRRTFRLLDLTGLSPG
jgi:hypothetical protein